MGAEEEGFAHHGQRGAGVSVIVIRSIVRERKTDRLFFMGSLCVCDGSKSKECSSFFAKRAGSFRVPAGTELKKRFAAKLHFSHCVVALAIESFILSCARERPQKRHARQFLSH